MAELKLVRGAGGGKGKKGGRAAIEAPDSLRSRQFARFVDLIGEGEMEGLVGSDVSLEMAERSIYLDGTPLRNEYGAPNFDLDGLAWSFVPGIQHQAVLPVSSGNTSTEVAVGQEVKYGNTGGGPVVRSIPETYIDAVRITVRVPSLYKQNTSNGDVTGTSVTVAIDVQSNGGGFVEVMTQTIKGKTSSDYLRSFEFDLPGQGPWDVRVRRVTQDSTTMAVQDRTYFDSMTKIVKEEFSYPNSAMFGMKIDSGLFSSIPTRGYLMDLLKVKVPTNYNPKTRVYTGLWDGTFKIAWTDNPAWCWYDLATNEKHGLGRYIDTSTIDKWALYAIAQYCDELVPDGFGGTEPRFTCNLYLQTREEALRVLMNMASIFRGITYWHSNSVFCSQDRPADPVRIFTAANVINGLFTYSGTARGARHTVALVSWNDPENLYRQTTEYVEDREGINLFGVRETEVVAFGCTSRGQAHRFGLWSLLTEREETDTISFRTSIEGSGLMPGDIIQVSDSARSGVRVAGRLMGATTTTLQLDAPVTLEPGKSYSITVMMPAGVSQERAIAWSGDDPEEVTEVTLIAPLDATPVDRAVWVLSTETLLPELWRVVSVLEAEPGILEITGLEHIPGKYALIEQGLSLQPRQTSVLSTVPGVVTNVVTKTEVRRLNTVDYSTRIAVSWTAPSSGAARYLVSWRRDDDSPKEAYTSQPSFDIDDVAAGNYTVSISAENALGRTGMPVTVIHVVNESLTEPDVQNLRFNPSFSGQDCPIIWDPVETAVRYTVQVYDGATLLREVSSKDPWFTYTYAMNLGDGGPRRSVTFKVLAHSYVGQSANPAVLVASNPAPAVGAVTLEPGPGQVGIMSERPSDSDLVGMIVWMSTTNTVPTTEAYKIYQGSDNAFMKTGLQPGMPVYFRVAFYDVFGTTGLNVSSVVSATPLASGGITKVTTLPANPSVVGGELAVFLDVADPAVRGLYGWDGTQWVFTRDGANLVANSVTADRLAVTNLSAISANLGTMTSGNITLDATGWIRGGAASWVTGKGIWQGYHDGDYKWRVGTPGGAGAAWDGVNFTIYGPAGEITLQSGGSVGGGGGYDSWADLVDDLGPITTGNVGTLIPTAAIGAAQIGSIALVGTSNFSVKTAVSGARMEMDSRAIKVFDTNGVKRVQLGNLTV